MELIARDTATQWGLELGAPFEANYSFVAPAGSDAVLKVGWQDDEESIHEPEALELWAGDGAIRLLRVDRAKRAMLLQRAIPGDDIAALEAEEATAIAVDVALRLWRPAGQPFRWIGDLAPHWLTQATPGSPAGQRLLEHARELFEELEISQETLVHGDFHHHNILAAGDRYVAIDPKAMLGEPEFDIPPFLWNPLGSSMRLAETERRLAVFAAAGLDEVKMRRWALIRGAYQCVGDWVGEHAVEILEAIQPT